MFSRLDPHQLLIAEPLEQGSGPAGEALPIAEEEKQLVPVGHQGRDGLRRRLGIHGDRPGPDIASTAGRRPQIQEGAAIGLKGFQGGQTDPSQNGAFTGGGCHGNTNGRLDAAAVEPPPW